MSPVLRCFQWNRPSYLWSSDRSAPALTLCPFPAFGRPVRTELGAPNSRASGPLFLQPCTRPFRGPPRRLTVVPQPGVRDKFVLAAREQMALLASRSPFQAKNENTQQRQHVGRCLGITGTTVSLRGVLGGA